MIKNILSLFDGMSCGQIALNQLGLKYNNYYASEIDLNAIKVTQNNFPNTIQLGDIKELSTKNIKDVFILLGGSPCQSFSNLGDGSGFEGESGLFWEYVRILKEVNPKYFLLENVVMKKEWQDIISEALGVQPIEINSSIFLPHHRRRLYWTNIKVETPKQRNYNISDYIENEGFPTYCTKDRFFKRKDIFTTLTASYYKGIRGNGRPAVSIKEGLLDEDRASHRMLTVKECELIQGVPIGYTISVSKTNAYKMLGNGWTVDVIKHILSFIKE